MTRTIIFRIVLCLAFLNACAGQDALESDSACARSFIYPIVVVAEKDERDSVDVAVSEVLQEMKLVENSGRFYFEGSGCYVQSQWISDTILEVVPFLRAEGNVDAEGFSNAFQVSFKNKLEEAGFSSVSVTEEIMLQD